MVIILVMYGSTKVDGWVPIFLKNHKWVMFQKWSWMGVVSELHHSCPSKLWMTYMANKIFWQFFGEKTFSWFWHVY
jgi:hypothetical protein